MPSSAASAPYGISTQRPRPRAPLSAWSPASLRKPVSSVGRVLRSTRPPCVLGLLGFRRPRRSELTAAATRNQRSRTVLMGLRLFHCHGPPGRNGQQGDGGEGEEPRDVEVEPVREDELEAEEESGGQGRKLERRLAPRPEVDGERADQEQSFEHQLQDVQVGDAARVVLPPVPYREGRLPPDLPSERPVPEDPGGVDRMWLEQEDREGRERGQHEGCGEGGLRARDTQTVRVGEPERSNEKRPELRPAGEGRGGAARPGRAAEPEAPDEEGGHDRVVHHLGLLALQQMRKAGMIASFVFEFDTYWVKG